MNPVILASLAAMLFGAAAPAGKALLQSFGPFQLAGLLYLGAALAVAPGLVAGWRTGREAAPGPLKWHFTAASFWKLTGALVAGGIIAPVLLMVALRTASAASVSIWLALEAPLTAVLAWLLFREHIGKLGAISIAGTSIAALILASGGGASGPQAATLAACACLGWALDNNLTSVVDGVSPAQITFWKGLVAGAINLTLGLILEGPLGAGQSGSVSLNVTMALVIGALAYGLSLILYIKSSQRLGAARSQMIFASAPFWGIAWSFAALHEQISEVQGGAAALLLVSLGLMIWEKHVHWHTHPALAHAHEHSHDDGHHDHTHEGDLTGQLYNSKHTHFHVHERLVHSHPHWPDLHHRHSHDDEMESASDER
ncbi:MAG TPA: DMT family transporter [Chroococcales cyanobacterium]